MRARNIKPGFFKNEDLSEIEPLGRLMFIGLWGIADREGKLEDRPKRIKAELFPYDDFSHKKIDALLNELQRYQLIIRYEIDNQKYIKVLNFLKHQRPHDNESPSVIPEPLATMVESTFNQGKKDEQPKITALRSDSLNDELLNDDIMNDECRKPAQKSPEIFSCAFFDVDKNYFDELRNEWTGLNQQQLMAEFKKMRDWCIDNAKQKKRLDAKGRMKGPRIFIRNWLNKMDVIPNNGSGYEPENTNCINHPRVSGAATREGRWYCRQCLDKINAPPEKFDLTIKDLTRKMTL